MKCFSGDILRGHMDTVVLAVLDAGEAYGYDIMQRLNAAGEGAFAMKEGTLYPVLYRMEDKGWLATRWEKEDVPRKGPRRRLYRLTQKGRKQLAKNRSEWRRFVYVVGRIVEV